jgi:hypothetical protein
MVDPAITFTPYGVWLRAPEQEVWKRTVREIDTQWLAQTGNGIT